MKFPKINEDFCPTGTSVGCEDDRCADPVFAAAHPDICGVTATGRLILKPETCLLCDQNVMQFATFLSGPNGEQPLTAGVAYSSSDTNVITIDASTGLATVIAVGEATISAAWQDLTATTPVRVLGEAGDCCNGIAERCVVLQDVSNSMLQTMVSGTKHAFCHTLWKFGIYPNMSFRIRFHPPATLSAGDGKNFESLVLFGRTAGLAEDWAAVDNQSGAVPSPDRTATDLAGAIDLALSLFGTAPPDDNDRVLQNTIIILSDGANRPALSSQGFYDLLQKITEFKLSGGTVMAIGLRATGDGYNLLQGIASSGYFLNVLPSNAATALAVVQRMMCGLCASTRGLQCDDVFTPLVPLMTSNILPSGKVLFYANDTEILPTDMPPKPADVYFAFDRNISTAAGNGDGGFLGADGYVRAEPGNRNALGYDFGSATVVTAWSINLIDEEYIGPEGNGTALGGTAQLRGSNDGTTWTDIGTQQTWVSRGQLNATFLLDAPSAPFNMFQVLLGSYEAIGQNNSAIVHSVLVKEIQFYSGDPNCTGYGCDPIDAGAQVPDPNPLPEAEA